MNRWRLVKKPLYKKSLKEIAESNNRFGELNKAIDWALSRNPKRFAQVAKNVYVWKTGIIEGFPQVRIHYKLNERKKTVTLLNITQVVVEYDF